MSGIPSTFNSRDVGVGGATAYAGAVAGLDGGAVLDAAEAYMDMPICDHINLGSANLSTSVVTTVLHQAVKEWTLDHVDLTLDALTTNSSESITVTFYKAPVGIKLASLGAGHIIGVASTMITSTITGDDVKIAFEFPNVVETERRFARGERFIVKIVGSASIIVGQKDICFLGRTRLI